MIIISSRLLAQCQSGQWLVPAQGWLPLISKYEASFSGAAGNGGAGFISPVYLLMGLPLPDEGPWRSPVL